MKENHYKVAHQPKYFMPLSLI